MKIKQLVRQMREPVNGLTHYGAALFAIVGLMVLLLISRGDWVKQETLLVYGASLVLMLTTSAAYHLIQGSPKRMVFLRKLDHSSIFILIAGTYTPICANLFTGFWQWGLFAIIWLLAIAWVLTSDTYNARLYLSENAYNQFYQLSSNRPTSNHV